MSSRFVSAGAIIAPAGEAAKVVSPPTTTASSTTVTKETATPTSSLPASSASPSSTTSRPSAAAAAAAAAASSSSEPTTAAPAPATSSSSSSLPTTTTTTTTSPPPPPVAPAETKPIPVTNNKKSQEWAEVENQLAAENKRREEARAKAASGKSEPTLYEVLQANKAAKQAAFEEANRIRNQFRALDDDEIDFLDEVAQKKREEELRAKRELEEGLKAFRERQHQKGSGDEDSEGEDGLLGDEESWAFDAGGLKTSRKRRKRSGAGLLVKKKVKADEGQGEGDGGVGVGVGGKKEAATTTQLKAAGASSVPEAPAKQATAASKPKGLGALVAYGSSDDEDD